MKAPDKIKLKGGFTLPSEAGYEKLTMELYSWGALRSWTLSGHFHETYRHDLIHALESLSGLPFDVSFINFDDVKDGALSGIDVIINAGFA